MRTGRREGHQKRVCSQREQGSARGVRGNLVGRRVLVGVLAALAIAGWLLVTLVLWMAKALRPIADNYLNGALAANGLLPGIVEYWETWSGSLFSYGLQIALVGLPLAALPWGLSSAFPFLATTVVVAGSMFVIAGSLVKRRTRVGHYVTFTLFVPLAMGLWWAYWWVPVATTPDPSKVVLTRAQIITFWQTVNVQYLVSTALLASLLVVCLRLPKERRWGRSLGLLAFGVLTGLSGPVLALSVVFGAVLLPLGLAIANGAKGQAVREIAIIVVASSGLALVAHGSPGNRERLTLLNHGESRATPDVLAIVRALGRPFSDFTDAYLSLGAALVVVAAASSAVVLWKTGMSIDGKAAFRYAALLAGFSFVFAVVIRVGDLFAYDGIWHIFPVRLIAWWSLVLLGAGIGTLLVDHFEVVQLLPASLFLLGASLILIGTSVTFMATAMNERLVTWNSGPAPIYLVSDIESGMWDAEWALLREIHGGPNRPVP